MTVCLLKPGSRVTTPKHGAGTVVVRELCNSNYVRSTLPPNLVLTGRWGVKLDDGEKYPWYKDGIAYFYPKELNGNQISI